MADEGEGSGEGQEGQSQSVEEQLAALKVELAETATALKKANDADARHRRERDKLRQQSEGENEKIMREAREQGAQETDAQWRRRMAKVRAEAAFGSHPRFANLVDVDKVEIDEEGNVVNGLEDQVKAIQTQFPEVFDAKTRATRSSVDASAGANSQALGNDDPLLADLKAKMGIV